MLRADSAHGASHIVAPRRARKPKGWGRNDLPVVDLWNYIVNGNALRASIQPQTPSAMASIGDRSCPSRTEATATGPRHSFTPSQRAATPALVLTTSGQHSRSRHSGCTQPDVDGRCSRGGRRGSEPGGHSHRFSGRPQQPCGFMPYRGHGKSLLALLQLKSTALRPCSDMRDRPCHAEACKIRMNQCLPGSSIDDANATRPVVTSAAAAGASALAALGLRFL
jgi:hypothetical protein